MVRELRSRHVADALFEGDQHPVLFDRKSEQVGVGHLLVAGNPRREWCGESGPTVGERPITVAGAIRELRQNGTRLFVSAWTRIKRRIGCDP